MSVWHQRAAQETLKYDKALEFDDYGQAGDFRCISK